MYVQFIWLPSMISQFNEPKKSVVCDWKQVIFVTLEILRFGHLKKHVDEKLSYHDTETQRSQNQSVLLFITEWTSSRKDKLSFSTPSKWSAENPWGERTGVEFYLIPHWP